VYLQAIGILVLFMAFSGLMMTRRLPALLALPSMAVIIAAIAGMPFRGILDQVLEAGAMRLSTPIAAVIFGGILAQVVRRTGVAEALVKRAAELSGDNVMVVSLAIAAACVLLFMTLTGLGAVILVASLALPVLLAVGVRPLAAGALLLMSIGVGGLLNVANWAFYMKTFGLAQGEVRTFALALFLPGLLAVGVFVAIDIAVRGRRAMWAEVTDSKVPRVGALSYLTPLLPVVLVLLPPAAIRPLLRAYCHDLPNLGELLEWDFPIVPAMLAGVLWGVIAARRPTEGRVQLLSASVIEGIKDVAPAIGLMIGIGMLFLSVSSDPVKACLIHEDPVTGAVSGPLAVFRITSPLGYVLLWGLLAPLALYRGPLNVWGMGIGIAGVLVTGGVLPAGAAMAALMSVAQIQGICDPTNTHNVWIASTLNVEVQDLLKRTLPYAWALAVVGLCVGAAMFLRAG